MSQPNIAELSWELLGQKTTFLLCERVFFHRWRKKSFSLRYFAVRGSNRIAHSHWHFLPQRFLLFLRSLEEPFENTLQNKHADREKERKKEPQDLSDPKNRNRKLLRFQIANWKWNLLPQKNGGMKSLIACIAKSQTPKRNVCYLSNSKDKSKVPKLLDRKNRCDCLGSRFHIAIFPRS